MRVPISGFSCRLSGVAGWPDVYITLAVTHITSMCLLTGSFLRRRSLRDQLPGWHRLARLRRKIGADREINHKNGIKFDNRLQNLELVTRRENMQHGFRELGFSRNRTKGAIHPKAKLWEEDVKKILELRAAGVRRHLVAEQFNVSDVAIRLIEKGDNWRHLTGLARSDHPAFSSPTSQGEGNARAKLTAADIPKIFEMSRAGLSQREIEKKFEVKQQAVSKVLLGLRWKHLNSP
jgi:hypothetical protein